MTARQEKVREALGPFATRDDRAAALAEVEEWEARANVLLPQVYNNQEAAIKQAKRAEAAEAALAEARHEAERFIAYSEERNDELGKARRMLNEAEAEADRLKAALTEYADLGPDEIPYADTINDPPDIGRVARAALAPADPNTT